MHRSSRLSLLLGVCLFISQQLSCASLNDGPCSYVDTVNVTGDRVLPNGSYVHEGVLVPPDYVAVYDYALDFEEQRIPVALHKRACICSLKACINLCCPWGSKFNYTRGSCERTVEEYQWPQPLLNVTMANGTLQLVHINEQFAVQLQRPCRIMFALEPEEYDLDEWRLQWNGELLLVQADIKYDKNNYCLVPTVATAKDSMEFTINPAMCATAFEQSSVKQYNAYAMLISIPFMLLTIVVYLWLPELRSLLGKALICYLVCLIISYIALACQSFISMDLERNFCAVLGYTAYYCLMAAFLWLSAISFHLWHTFCRNSIVAGRRERRRFLIYSIYAWLLAAVCTLLTWHAQEVADIPDHYRPGIAGGDFCWLNMSNWSAMIYFYGPILLIILSNIVMFVLTACSIQKACADKEHFGLFLRLFILMGLTWSLELISYLVGSKSKWSKIFYLTDLLNASLGLLIFMLFVMRKKVRQLIMQRFCPKRQDKLIFSEQVQLKDIPEASAVVLLPQDATSGKLSH